MHVGVEKTIAEYLGEKNFHTQIRQLGNIHALAAQQRYLANGCAVHAAHHHDFRVAIIPEYFRHQKQIRVSKIAPQLRAIRRFAHQIEFIM